MKESIQKYRFKDSLNLEFEILDLSERLLASQKMMTVPHRAQFYHLLWIEQGKGTHFVDFNPIPLTDNMLIFIPHNSVNKYDVEGVYKGKAILFTDAFFCKHTRDLHYLQSSILFSDLYDIATLKLSKDVQDLLLSFEVLEREFLREPDSAQYQLLHNSLYSLLLQAEREMRKQGFEELRSSANLDYLVLFKDLLEKNFAEFKSVHKYASELSISDKQLHKATTSLLDKTPKQIIDERVLLEAKRLLVHSNEAIKEIAYELGYDEPTNFIKYFRKHTGCTPSEFREHN